MKFNTIRDMEEKLKTVTSVKDLEENITVSTQGKFISFRFIGAGAAAGTKMTSYLSDESADSMQVEYEGDDERNITVTNVKVNRA